MSDVPGVCLVVDHFITIGVDYRGKDSSEIDSTIKRVSTYENAPHAIHSLSPLNPHRADWAQSVLYTRTYVRTGFARLDWIGHFPPLLSDNPPPPILKRGSENIVSFCHKYKKLDSAVVVQG